MLVCIIHEGRRDSGDLNQVVTLFSWQPLPYARPAGRAYRALKGSGVCYHRGLAGALQHPTPFWPALFQPTSRSFLKPTPRHSDHVSSAQLLHSPSEPCLACGRGSSAILPNLLPVTTGMVAVCPLRQHTQAPQVTVCSSGKCNTTALGL